MFMHIFQASIMYKQSQPNLMQEKEEYNLISKQCKTQLLRIQKRQLGTKILFGRENSRNKLINNIKITDLIRHWSSWLHNLS